MGSINDYFEVVQDNDSDPSFCYANKWYASSLSDNLCYLHADGTEKIGCMPGGWFDTRDDVVKAFCLWQRNQQQDNKNDSAHRFAQLAWEQSTQELVKEWDDRKVYLLEIVDGLLENLSHDQLVKIFGEKLAYLMEGLDSAGKTFLLLDESKYAKS